MYAHYAYTSPRRQKDDAETVGQNDLFAEMRQNELFAYVNASK
jgi:hypothetical protein